MHYNRSFLKLQKFRLFYHYFVFANIIQSFKIYTYIFKYLFFFYFVQADGIRVSNTLKNVDFRPTEEHADDVEHEDETHPHWDKPHGHHHGHSHDLSSVKAIAYTIIAGDGLHNLCDGIAIGAAFANDIFGGFSTAIAVLCHELPHELGNLFENYEFFTFKKNQIFLTILLYWLLFG